MITLHDVALERIAEQERDRLIAELQAALADVKALSGLLPICASCKKIRDDNGHWRNLEHYIQEHSEAQFSHGLCGDCIEKLYPGAFRWQRPGEGFHRCRRGLRGNTSRRRLRGRKRRSRKPR